MALLRIGKMIYMKYECVRTTHMVDITRIPCKQCIMPADFACLYASNFIPFEYMEKARST